MTLLGSPDYAGLASRAISTYQRYAESQSEKEPLSAEPTSSRGLQLDFDQPTPSHADHYLAGNFAPGTYIDRLESDVENEGGLYNVAVDPDLRTPYSLIMPTRDYHPQSASLRPAYLIHAYRLLEALEEALPSGQVIAVYDCGERSGVLVGHKCIRFYVMDEVKAPSMPHELHPILQGVKVETFAGFLCGSNAIIPPEPHYNLIMSRGSLMIVRREDDGFRNEKDGRWDGARLCGVAL